MIRFFAASLISIVSLCALVSAQDKAVVSKSAEKLPVSYGLVVDNSGSFRTLLDRVVSAAAEVVEDNGAEDEAFVVTFVDTPKIVLRQEFTFKKAELHDAVENMFIEGGQTAILDAVKSAADYLAQNARSDGDRLHALVLVTDGEDRASVSKIEDVIKILKENNIRVFVVAMSDTKIFPKVIDRLAKETGGTVVVSKTRADLGTAVKQISAQMRTR
jgi:VWFA-related protein